MIISNTVTIFYSWQSDLPRDTNQKAIASCIKQAFISIEEENDGFKLILDEATRDEAGSPDIPSTIFAKISKSDIFICDVSTINDSEDSKRKTPNPNVLIELGYAVAVLGWERIVMVFNKQFGSFPSDLPFDLDKRRTTPFKIIDKNDKSGKNDLTLKISSAIKTILSKNPTKPRSSTDLSDSEIKRNKDIHNLLTLFSWMHIPTLDLFIDELPDKILSRIFWFWYSFHETFESNTFHIYEEDLASKLTRFHNLWGYTLNYGHLFLPNSSGTYYTMQLPYDIFMSERNQQDFKKLSKQSTDLKEAFNDLTRFVRENYLEVDLNQLSDKAFKKYKDYENENDKRWGE